MGREKTLIVFDFDGTVIHPWWQGFSLVRKALLAKICKNRPVPMGLLKEALYQICDVRTYVHIAFEFILPRLADKYRLAILTNSSRRRVVKVLGDLRHYFDDVVGKEDVEKPKPDPEGMYLILCRIGCGPKEVLFIGDTVSDIIAGRKAGVKTGFVTWGFDTVDDVKRLKPDYIFKTPADILGLL